MKKVDWLLSRVTPAIAILAPLAALVFSAVPLSLDGPSHVYNGVIMRQLLAGNPDYTTQFHFTSVFIPNWLASVLTTGATTLLGVRWALVAMNVSVTLLVLFALGRVVARAAASGKPDPYAGYAWTILVVPALSVFLLYGFWGFLISAAFCLIAISMIKESVSVAGRIGIAALVLFGWWAHPLPVLLTGLVPLAGYVKALCQSSRLGTGAALRLTIRFCVDILPWAVAALLIAGFTLTLAKVDNGVNINHWQESIKRLMNLTRPGGLSDPSATAGGIYNLFVGLMSVGAFAAGLPGNAFRWQIAAVACLFAIMYFAFPDVIGNAFYISIRILWFFIIFLTVLALSSSLRANGAYMRGGAIVATLISLLFAAEYAVSARRLQPSFEELQPALQYLPPHAKLLVLGYRLQPSCSRTRILRETSPESHLPLIEIARRSAMVLNDYEAATWHFPLQYNDRRFAAIARGDYRFTADDESKWSQALHGADSESYMLSWGIPNGASLEHCTERIDAPLQDQLRRDYTLVYEHAGHARTQLWRRN